MSQTEHATLQQVHDALAEAIAKGHGDRLLEIPYDPGYATLGGLPSVKVRGVHAGFDWDDGRYFITPDKRLGVPGEELQKRLRSAENTLGHMHRVLASGTKTDAERLADLRGYLRELGDRLAGRTSDQAPG